MKGSAGELGSMLRRETMLQASVVDIQTHIKNHRREQGGREGVERPEKSLVKLLEAVYSDC